jgi:putative membrane protein
MKSLIRNTAFNSISLYLLPFILSGVNVSGGYGTYIIGGLFLAIMFKVLKPMLNIISLPLNLVTLGMFSFLINAFIFYLATAFVPQIQINAFTFEGLSFGGFVIPRLFVNTFFAYVAAAFLHVSIVSFLHWLIKR